jgi:hypothetical protein
LIKIDDFPMYEQPKKIGNIIRRRIIPPLAYEPHQSPQNRSETSGKSSLRTEFSDDIDERKNGK